MHFIYFDETKVDPNDRKLFIGGFIIEQNFLDSLENDMMTIQHKYHGTNILKVETELHGEHIFHGKGSYARKNLANRINLFDEVSNSLINNKVSIRIISIDVDQHRKKYVKAVPEYSLALMLMLERTCDFLSKKSSQGMIFGDYEKDEITDAIRDFAEYKQSGTTPMYFGRPLGQLKDTIYFTQSHHSRFLQAADMVVYMANRYERNCNPRSWHDQKLHNIWKNLKQSVNYHIQFWP